MERAVNRLSVSRKSALLVTGRHIRIDELRLDGSRNMRCLLPAPRVSRRTLAGASALGSLEISVADGASLHIRSLVVQNEGWRFEDLSPTVLEDDRCPEVLQMRGYTLRREQARQVAVTTPGHHEMDHGELVLVSRTAVSFCDGAADRSTRGRGHDSDPHTHVCALVLRRAVRLGGGAAAVLGLAEGGEVGGHCPESRPQPARVPRSVQVCRRPGEGAAGGSVNLLRCLDARACATRCGSDCPIICGSRASACARCCA